MGMQLLFLAAIFLAMLGCTQQEMKGPATHLQPNQAEYEEKKPASDGGDSAKQPVLSNQVKKESITPAQLSEHGSAEDCWVAYKGKVYDVTAYLSKHPGGAGTIAAFCGTAGAFENAFIAKHGTSKERILETQAIFIGEYAG
ncbi:MAG: hypothetical protein N3G22_00230 [Candidatus Micrarchaeota archaeon]|nr:hypothetical protein [Candidatus Micrarchaeota archaeon]